jgi:spermidine dehydrogenase
MARTDRELGMASRITRRDFLHDAAIAGLGLAMPLPGFAAAPDDGVPYPPTRTGLRGSHPGSFEVAHALAREGKHFDNPTMLDERYDLVVVGAGISGLAAAYFHRKRHAQARILILDNHDDFGGHAKRNEFHQGGPMRLAWGGTVNMEYTKYSPVAIGLIGELGIDIPRLREDTTFAWLQAGGALQPALLFNEARYGSDVLVRGITLTGLSPGELAAHVHRFPLPPEARAKFEAFLRSDRNLLDGMPDAEREAWMHRTSYTAWLREHFALPEPAIQILSNAPAGYWGLPAECLSVAECLGSGLPGAHVLGGLDVGVSEAGGDTAMFPDGNSSISRTVHFSATTAFFGSVTTGCSRCGMPS